ncbi:MAG: hypothetical protein E6933_08010 [Clostridiales bacterium]|nr:hypothetical protein [Clostridiales bacterium]
MKMSIEKGRPFEQSPKMKGIFYEAMQEKKLSESPKPLILLGFSKSSVSPLAPKGVQLLFLNKSSGIYLPSIYPRAAESFSQKGLAAFLCLCVSGMSGQHLFQALEKETKK